MTESDKISVIIPCLNEEDNLKELLPYLLEYGGESLLEIIIADGGSKDNTIAIAEAHGAVVVHAIRNRATQMNQGAEHAKGDLLYFVHADTRPYSEYAKIIQASVSNGKKVGCFRYRFDSNSALLRCNAWFTRFNGIFSGGGDQSLFITKTLFNSLEGFDTSFSIMEDFELVRRIRQNFDFQVLPYEMTVSARKYEENSWLKVQLANFIAFSLFLIKVKPAKIKSLYLNFLSK